MDLAISEKGKEAEQQKLNQHEEMKNSERLEDAVSIKWHANPEQQF